MKKFFFRFVSFALAAVILLAFAPRAAAAFVLAGDINANGGVDSDDAIYLLRHVLFGAEFPAECQTDMDGDGDTDSDDAIYLLRHVLFPAQYPIAGASRYLRGETAFSDMKYERPDFVSSLSYLESFLEEIDKHELSSEVIIEELDFLDALYADIYYERGMLELERDLDVTDKSLQQESSYFASNFSEFRSKYLALYAKIIDDPVYGALFEGYSEAYKQSIRDAAASADDEYIELTVRLNELVMKYNDRYSQVVEVNGEKIALGDVTDPYVFDLEYDRICGETYLGILSVMRSFARREGYGDDVLAYMYEHEYGRDYTASDVRNMIQYVKTAIVPVFKSVINRYSYYYRDVKDVFDYDPQLAAYFSSIDPKMREAYEYLKEFGLYCATDSPDALPGAYTTYLGKYDAPMIYASTDGSVDDLSTFIHEFGHFYNTYLHGEDSAYQLDICEIHSQANELMFLPEYAAIFGKTAGDTLRRNNLILSAYYLVQACVFTEFELRAYSGSYDNCAQLDELFDNIISEFGVDDMFYHGEWKEVNHFFEVPHYYVSYATSLVPALQIYSVFAEDREAGVELYNYITEKGDCSASFLSILSEAGLSDPFTEETYAAIAEMLVESIS